MELLQFLPENLYLAIVVSLIFNIVIAVVGVIPSTLLTAGNILYFGFTYGLMVSVIGEAAGAIISFYIYRLGVRAITNKKGKKINHPLLRRLQQAEGGPAILLVLVLRIVPFVPSGLVTLVAAMSKMKGIQFAIASTIGKIPALLIEAYSIYSFINWELEYQVTATIIGIGAFLLYLFVKKRSTE